MTLHRFIFVSGLIGVLLLGCGSSDSPNEPYISSGGTGGQGATGGGGSGTGGATGGTAGSGGTTATGGGGTGTGGGLPDGGDEDSGTGGGPSLRFVAYGDTRSRPDDHQQVVDAFATVMPELVIHTGDLWDGYNSSQWENIVTSNANIANLLNNNLFLVSRGNHESANELLGFSPTLVRDNNEEYAFTMGNAFFISLGYSSSSATSFLEQQLQSSASSSATWRVVFCHVPIYSGGSHGADGVPAVEALFDQYNVSLFFAGHDHIYERSHQMYGEQVADNGDALQASNGTVYIVAGGGGAPLYTASTIPSTHTSESSLHYVDVTATGSTLTVKAFKPNGSVLDSFTMSR